MMLALRSCVKFESSTLHPTGIPPHVQLHVGLENTLHVLDKLPDTVAERVEHIIE